MFRSKKLWLFTTVLLCLAVVMLLHWSQGRAQQEAARQQLIGVGEYVNAQPAQNLFVLTDGSASLDAAQAQTPKLSDYWIGIDGAPADDVLRAQLELPAGQGVIINQVVANSPAERAGLQQYDALLSTDDKPIGEISDLANHVQQRRETPIVLKLVRSGKPLTIEVTPQRRPASQTGETCPQLSPLDDPEFVRRVYLDALGVAPTAENLNVFMHDLRQDKRVRLANELLRRSTIATKSCASCHAGQPTGRAESLYRWIADYEITALAPIQRGLAHLADVDRDGGLDLYIANGPLAVTTQPPPSLPDDMTITITRKGNEPVRIQVTRGDQSWGTTENKVSDLPVDIRGYVSQFFATPRTVAVQPLTTYRDQQAQNLALSAYKLARDKAVSSKTPSTVPASDAEKPAVQTAPALVDVEKQLKTLTQQLEQLQKTLDELRKSSAVPPEKPDGEPQP